jgi:hypothetical protein
LKRLATPKSRRCSISFFLTAEANAEIGDRLTQRVLAEVHTIYGQGVGQSSLRGFLDRWHRVVGTIQSAPLLIAFGAVACVAVALLTVSTLLTRKRHHSLRCGTRAFRRSNRADRKR